MLLDALLVVFILAGFFTGFRRGLIYSLFAFFALLFGLLLAMKYSALLADYCYRQEITRSKFLPFISFALILIASLAVMKLCYRVVQSVADTLFLGTVNKVAGGVLWAVMLALVYCAALWYLDQLQFIPADLKASSKSFARLIAIAPEVMENITEWIPFFRGTFDDIENLFRQLPAETEKGITV